MPFIFIIKQPKQLLLGHTAEACHSLLAFLLAAATPHHLDLIPINATCVTQVVGVQLSIMLWVDAAAVVRVALLAGSGAVLSQGLSIGFPSHGEGMSFHSGSGAKCNLSDSTHRSTYQIWCCYLSQKYLEKSPCSVAMR